MATPKWGQLHIRLAARARDAVASASLDGGSLKKLDRDAYLNFAYQKYVALFYQVYMNDFEKIESAMQALVRAGTASITSVGTIGSAGLPADYGFYLKMTRSGVDYVKRITAEEYVDIKNGKDLLRIASTGAQYALPESQQIRILPATVSSGDYDLAYLILPADIFYDLTVGDDIPLSHVHFNSIIAFALSEFFLDKQEFESAAAQEKIAYSCAPFSLKMEAEK